MGLYVVGSEYIKEWNTLQTLSNAEQWKLVGLSWNLASTIEERWICVSCPSDPDYVKESCTTREGPSGGRWKLIGLFWSCETVRERWLCLSMPPEQTTNETRTIDTLIRILAAPTKQRQDAATKKGGKRKGGKDGAPKKGGKALKHVMKVKKGGKDAAPKLQAMRAMKETKARK